MKITTTICDNCHKNIDEDYALTPIDSEDTHTVNGTELCSECYEELPDYMNEEQVRASFESLLEEYAFEFKVTEDKVSLNEDYNNYTDGLCKDNKISEELYNDLESWK